MRIFRLSLSFALATFAQDEPAAPVGRREGGYYEPFNARTFASPCARNIGPAFISGRVSQIAVPESPSHYLVAEASGEGWLTRNDGTSWPPVFEKQLDDVNLALRGDTIWRSRKEGVPSDSQAAEIARRRHQSAREAARRRRGASNSGPFAGLEAE